MKLSVKKSIADKTASLDKLKEERDKEIKKEKEVSPQPILKSLSKN